MKALDKEFKCCWTQKIFKWWSL